MFHKYRNSLPANSKAKLDAMYRENLARSICTGIVNYFNDAQEGDPCAGRLFPHLT
ncbi:hypothetical protein [Desulfoscipio gibsoniae]|uniref:hypothetical protein n=1 Tax=Desulfoscipio gibsoniae TaxID=102134 RepID=UPI0012FF4FFE|nr:hypothetical protein [Desulfoscipio gibsoniae]